MAFTRTAPPRTVALASVLAMTPALATTAAAADDTPPVTTHAAGSTLLTLTVDSVPALAVNAFQGSYATSRLSQNGGDAAADAAQDPDGVLDRITLDQPAQSKTHSDPAKNWADSQTAVEYTLHGKRLYSIAAVDSHAECASAPLGATTYVHTDPDSVNVLGTNVAVGKTTIPVTGSQLGVAAVDHGSLSVAYTTTASQEQQTSAISAHAHLDLTISGSFYDKAGKELYSGPLQKLRLGDVQATCRSSATAAPSPTTAPPTPGGPSASATGPLAQGPAQPSTLKGSAIPAANNAVALHRADHATPATPANPAAHPRSGANNEPAVPVNGPMQPAGNAATTSPESGDTSIWWALLSVLGLSGGVGLYLATRRRGRHQ